jgi:hypothetical protein
MDDKELPKKLLWLANLLEKAKAEPGLYSR